MTPEEKLKELGLVLPKPHVSTKHHLPNYRGWKIAGPFLFLAGHGPEPEQGRGKVGLDVTIEQAYEHAKITGLFLLAAAKDALGELDRVESVVRITGNVNAVPEFKDHPLVINGCSDLFVAVFGPERGRHPRSSIGVGSLPHQITVEIDAIMLIRP
jgi:enamine deaminase RidA (YjgF/YER057c/UK114 family)